MTFLRVLCFGVLVLAVSACSSSTESPRVSDLPGTRSGVAIDIGHPLFKESEWPAPPQDLVAAKEAIRLAFCHLTVLDRVDVPSKEDGTVEWFGAEIVPGEVIDLKDVYTHPRTRKQYARLRHGEKVKRGQVVALLNDDRASLEVEIADSNIEGAKQELKAAAESIIFYRANVKIEDDAKSSKQALIAAQANLAKAIAEEAGKSWGVKRYEGEHQKAQEKLNNHAIRAPFDGEIVQFFKHVGEGVKAGEPILQIQNTARLGVEGNLEVQYAGRAAVGTEVFLEPSLMEPPSALRSPHASSKPISAVAVGIRSKKQYILSASEDGSVHVWDAATVHASWRHPGAVRALAITRPTTEKQLIATGCDDGKVRIYAVEEFGKEPLLTLDAHHEGGVRAAAFSPDGSTCLTSDDRGDIHLSDTATGKLRYTFPREHNGSVTGLNFTPQCRAVSVGSDGLAAVWKVGDKSADVETRFDHRAGDIGNLGISDDGSQMLLDLDKNRLRVIDLATQRNLGTLQQANDGKFTSFALLSPTIDNADRVILTNGSADGILQLWRWTSGPGKGSELKKLVSPGYVPITCAAFSPIGPSGTIVAGTRKGDVHVWAMPRADELNNRFKARITNIAPNLESSGKSVRIHAELDNTDPKLYLRPGTTATVVIPQK